MNRALFYLWFALLKRRSLCFCLSLRRPARLIGVVALAALFSALFHYRRNEIFGHLVKPQSLFGGALIMMCGSAFKGFLQRGLVFDPPDLEFVFTGPFTEKQVILYRLLPGYVFAIGQALGFGLLLAAHLPHPVLAAACIVLFQSACFHVSAGVAVVSGKMSATRHHRVRWMLLATYLVLTLLYLRIAWDIRMVPQALTSIPAQLLFYPAINLPESGMALLQQTWITGIFSGKGASTPISWQSVFYFIFFLSMAAGTLAILLRYKGNLFETSILATTRVAEKRSRIEQGKSPSAPGMEKMESVRLIEFHGFQGAGAIVWKNLLVASRCRRELLLAFAFTLVFTAPLVAMLKTYRQFVSLGGAENVRDISGFNLGIALMLAVLPFILQRTFPFDFRKDGPHLLGLRALPFSGWAVVLAELAVPTILALAFQGMGVALLVVFARFDWDALLLISLSFPAVTLALNCVWNLYYLLSAAKSVSGEKQFATAAGTLMVVSLSFLIFFPAAWTAIHVGQSLSGRMAIPLAASSLNNR